jgi:heat shock protein HtpX
MDRYHVRQTLREAGISSLEESSFVTGILLLVAGTAVAWVRADPGGLAWALGTFGLAALGVCAIARGVRLYRANVAASLPQSVGRVGVRAHPGRVSTATTALFASTAPSLLVRLCMRGDIPVPDLVVEPGIVANAWTTGGRIHLTRPLLTLLDESELEAVLAHELAHLAHRDAAVMDVCSAPSRMLLGFVGFVVPGFRGWLRNIFVHGEPSIGLGLALLSVLCIPPAFFLGWVSRLSVLRMSRVREFAADAAAANLTGRPSALASALMKLDRDGDRMPRADLRQVQARAVLSILGTDSSRLGPLFCTHPPTAARVKRLEAIEVRLQAGGRAVRFEE